MLGEFSRKEESHGSLDLSGGESVLLVISDKFGRLRGNLLEDVVDEGVHDGHGFLGDSSLWVNLLEDSVDVDGEGLGSLLGSLYWSGFLSLGGFSFSWHFNINFIFNQQQLRLNGKIEILKLNLVIISISHWMDFSRFGFLNSEIF